MIRKIGVLFQDANSRGFLEGIKKRLRCNAELVEPSGALAKSRNMTRRQAKRAWLDFQRKGVDLIVRFTDADRSRWQNVKSDELAVFPDDAKSLLVCGVAVDNMEHWLALDREYLAKVLDIDGSKLDSETNRTGVIKKAIFRQRRSEEPASAVTARIVKDAPPEVFRRWLQADSSLAAFYNDCRAAAKRADCHVPNELES